MARFDPTYSSVLRGMLATSLAVGLNEYRTEQDSFCMVAEMHGASYTVGILGGLIMAVYVYAKRKPASQIVELQPNGVTIDLVALFSKA